MPTTGVEPLTRRRCRPCSGETPQLSEAEVARLLGEVAGWERRGGMICKEYRFENYHGVLAFVNAVAWVAHREDHHPDLAVSYNRCRVEFTTHAVGGLSENDFISAAKVDALLKEPGEA